MEYEALKSLETNKIKEMIKGTTKREKLVKIEEEGQEYETTAKNVFVIGKDKGALAELN